ncbi:PVC-type heme-binding CxxCH protein [Blastopirellula marina]|uniref:Cytochrome C n=1 Tax=Blastopirellula marina TaxID=124 RepID=A0A2S8GQ68_9BACT|nr:PVC-type heme-binding CxxCH protein [Blastopirellula marina]PQO46573.1 cytochrome C [Blastopirellula marina]
MRSLLILLLAASPLLADFPEIHNSERDTTAKPMPPEQAAASFEVPEGFEVETVFAEPDVQNPIAMAWDAQGRLWIAENYTYDQPSMRFDRSLRDRVLYFEDTDGDGKLDKRNVFVDDVQMLTSVEVGLGGVWLMCPPQVLFIPDADHDGKPDGPAEVVLDGFTVAQDNYHNFANGLRFGPDGWLYGRCGHSCPGHIGLPGTPDEQRLHMEGGIWRYHPKTKQVEVLTTGTTNPWGHDWDEHGELFFINTVNGHLWHMIPGAHFMQNFALDPNPHTYELIDTHADHWHFDTTGRWQDSRDGVANKYGGGHAHVGMMIYQGNNWPEAYRGNLFTINIHGMRANQDILVREGSGYVGQHGKDILISGDPFFRGMELSPGPDGSVYVIDWSDTGECHDHTGVHRTSGRIYRVSYQRAPRFTPPPEGESYFYNPMVQQLDNNWAPRMARLVLQEKYLAGEDMSQLVRLLRPLVTQPTPEQGLTSQAKHDRNRLRYLWTLHVIGGTNRDLLSSLLDDPNEHIRTWAIRLLTEHWPIDDILSHRAEALPDNDPGHRSWGGVGGKLVVRAQEDDSGLVLLTLASTLQRTPLLLRSLHAMELVKRAEFADDHNLPLITWYGLIPLAEKYPEGLVEVAKASTWPTTTKLIARRLTEEIEANPQPINDLVAAAIEFDPAKTGDVLSGMSEALRGWSKAPKPKAWDALAAKLDKVDNEALQQQVREIGAVFGDGRALDELRKLATSGDVDLITRQSALTSLIEAKPDDLRELCEKLIRVPTVNVVAARGLAKFDDPEAAKLLIANYRRFRENQRAEVLGFLLSRPSFAHVLLDALDQKRIRRTDVTAIHVRQLRSLGDESLNKRANEVWGEVRESSEEKQKAMAYWKDRLSEDNLAHADMSQGRVVFEGLCAKCHRLYGEGSNIGPDLTGSNRGNLDYLLQNIIDPSAIVSAQYRMTVLQMDDGRVLSGIVAEQTEKTLTLQTATERVTVEKEAIEAQKQTSLSPMPDLQLGAEPNQPGGLLTDEQFLDLISYLKNPSQVPLPSK